MTGGCRNKFGMTGKTRPPVPRGFRASGRARTGRRNARPSCALGRADAPGACRPSGGSRARRRWRSPSDRSPRRSPAPGRTRRRSGAIKGRPEARASAATMQKVSASQPWISASALAIIRAIAARSRIGSSRWVCGLSPIARRARALSAARRSAPARRVAVAGGDAASITSRHRFSAARRPTPISKVASSGKAQRSSRRARKADRAKRGRKCPGRPPSDWSRHCAARLRSGAATGWARRSPRVIIAVEPLEMAPEPAEAGGSIVSRSASRPNQR